MQHFNECNWSKLLVSWCLISFVGTAQLGVQRVSLGSVTLNFVPPPAFFSITFEFS
jgi:hypothetical protein